MAEGDRPWARRKGGADPSQEARARAGRLIAAGPWRRLARAKVNLYLHVLGRRTDGYHLLDSLVVFPAFGDSVETALADEVILAVDGPYRAPVSSLLPERNLAVRAARLLVRQSGNTRGVAIRLTKRIPVGAGLGGGSTDAAAVLHLGNEMLGLGLSVAELQRIGLALGADVPACLMQRSTFFGGIGEQVEAAPRLPALDLVLVWPGTALSTADVFAALAVPSGAPPRPRLQDIASAEALADALVPLRNDLEPAATRLLPSVAAVLAALRAQAQCLLARMTGSGSACFGLFLTAAAAATAAARIQAAHADWWVMPTTTRHG